jgi:[acyl-carrier-protein] S-malonyltransferase
MASVLLAVVDPAGERVTMRVGLMSTMADVVAALEARTGVLLLEHELRCGDGSALDPSTYVADQFAAALAAALRRGGGGGAAAPPAASADAPSMPPSATTLPTPSARATSTATTNATSATAATAGKLSPDDPAAKAEGALEALLCADLDAGAARALRGPRAVGGDGSDGGGDGSALAHVTLRAVSSVPLRRRPRYVLLFGGQGAQRVGMGGAFWRDGSAAVRSLWAQASALLGYDLLEVCVRGPAEVLRRTSVAQPAIFVSSLAALSALRREVPEAVEDVAAVAGFSLGEFSALVFGGALRFADGLRLVKARGDAMEEAANSMMSRGPMGNGGGGGGDGHEEDADAAALRAAMEAAGGSGLGDAGAMLSVSGVADDKLERLCGECRRHCDAHKGEAGGHTQFVQLPPSAMGGLHGQHGAPRETVCQISNFLFPRGRVVSGHSHACDWLAAAIEKSDPEARVKRLRVAAAFHSPFMAPAQRALEAALAEAPLRMPRVPVYSNVTGRPYTSIEEMRQLLGQQLTAGVRWEHTMRHMLAQQRDAAPADGLRFVDVGPGKQLAAMLRKLDPEKGKACIVMGDGCL